MGEFPLLWNDWEWFLHFEWEQQTSKMRQYVEATESAFKKQGDAFSDWITQRQGTLSETDAEQFGDECAVKILALQDDFPALARQMAFCAVFAYFEHQLIHVCDALRVFRKLASDVRDEKDRGILGAKSYLKHVAKIAFPDSILAWNKLTAYGRIRNLIMHNNSQVPRDKLERFAQDSKLTGGIPIDEFHRFGIPLEYCLAAIDTVQEFFDALVKVLPRETEQDRKEGLDNLVRALRAAGFSDK